MNRVLFVVIFFYSNNTFSQSDNLASDPLASMGNSPAFYLITKENADLDVEGSKYLFKDLKSGTIRMNKSKNNIEGVELRFNILDERLEVRRKDVVFIALNRYISAFTINEDEVFSFQNTTSLQGKGKPQGFIRIHSESNDITIYSKLLKKKSKNDSSTPYSSFRDYVEYTDKTKYYFHVKSKSEFVEITSKKKLLADFPALKNYGSIPKGKLKNAVFLQKLVDFIEAEN